MINSGRNILLNRNNNPALPNMSGTITGWFLDISFNIVERYLNGADWEHRTVKTINTRGVVRPPSDKDLKILREGSWAWEWLQIHCLPDVQIETNQFVEYDGIYYKVMGKKPWGKYGYMRYTLLEAFQAEELG